MADVAEAQGEANESFEMGEPEPYAPPAPTIDDIAIPPPPDEPPPDDLPPPSFEEDSNLHGPADEYEAPTDPDPEVDQNQSWQENSQPEPAEEQMEGEGAEDELPPPPPADVTLLPVANTDNKVVYADHIHTTLEVKDDDEILIEGQEPSEPSESSNGIHNANTLPSTRPMTTTAATTSSNGHAALPPEQRKAEMKRISNYRREAVMWVIIFILAAGAVAVVFYFSYSIAVAKSDPLPNGEFTIRVRSHYSRRAVE